MEDKKRGPAEWKRLNILGIEISIYRWPLSEGGFNFNAYAKIPNSRYLTISALGNPTFRHEDEIGVDTAHRYNRDQTEDEKLIYALNEIERIIAKARVILQWEL